jgi:hypothetical protein
MTQPDRTVHPALAGIWATIREKIYKGLQKRPLYRRTVPVVNTDDAAQSACLSLQVARGSHGEKEWRNRHPEKTASPFHPGVRPEAEFSGNENGVPNRC